MLIFSLPLDPDAVDFIQGKPTFVKINGELAELNFRRKGEKGAQVIYHGDKREVLHICENNNLLTFACANANGKSGEPTVFMPSFHSERNTPKRKAQERKKKRKH